MRLSEILGRIRTTNALAELLYERPEAIERETFDAIDAISMLRQAEDLERYDEKEKDIPRLICDVLEKEGRPSTKLVKRTFIEEDGWLVRVECREGGYLDDHGHEVYSGSHSGELVPAMIEDETVSMHFVKVYTPRVFVRTLSLPMLAHMHHL